MAKAPKVEYPADLNAAWEPAAEADVDTLEQQIQQMKADGQKALDSREGDHATRMAVANWYMAAIEKAQSRQTELVATGEEQQAELDAARERFGGAAPAAAGDDKPADADAKTDETDEEKAERERKAAAGEVQAAPSGGDAAPANTDANAGALVASAGTKRRSAIRAAALAGHEPRPMPRVSTEGSDAYLTASIETRGFAAGQKIGWDDLGAAAIDRFDQLSGQPGGGRTVLPFGRVNIPTDPGLVASAARGSGFTDLDKAIEWALSSERLKKETGQDTLLAAGGWCAPSETLYDLINLITTDGMIDVPGITVTRGGVRYSLGPDFTAVYNSGADFTRTETQAIAGLAKPIVNIPCPTFTDNRMVVDGLYLTGDILSSKGYPEAYADYTQKALASFAHYVNAQSIADMVTLSGSAIDLTVDSGPHINLAISTELLGAVELQVMDMRYKNRLSLTNAVEVVFPYWLKGAIRSDICKRQGYEEAANLPDSAIDEYFALRGASVQWVYDWQDAFTGVSGGFGSASAITSWPTTALFMVHPQGAFVRALSDVIELSAVYDSTLLTTNQYVALFMEQARLTLKRAWDVRLVKVPVNVSGATGAAIDYTGAGRQPTV